MRDYMKFYIGGAWVAPLSDAKLDVINPATEAVAGAIALGTRADVDEAVKAAKNAFPAWSRSSRQERLALLERIAAEYERRAVDLTAAITEEMGAPTSVSRDAQVDIGRRHLAAALAVLRDFVFEERRNSTILRREPIGVCGLITPWNWPMNQIVCKVAPALATGCTMVLKPSEVAPFSGQIFAEIMHAAGAPAGVFNLVHGDGPGVGVALSSHPDVDMVSFTGSTRAGIEVARNAAPTVKRVSQELGGKSPFIVLDDETFATGVGGGVGEVMFNSGQSCDAPTRILVPRHRMEDAIAVADEVVAALTIGDPLADPNLGPVVSQIQYDRIQALIQAGIDEGATLVAGGTGRPAGLDRGYYVKPTIFAHVSNDMVVARQEIFGPVICLLAYDTIDEAVAIANDTEYGLAAYVSGADADAVYAIAAQLRSGRVVCNGGSDIMAPFGGYKQSGNGREYGDFGFVEFLEIKAITRPA